MTQKVIFLKKSRVVYQQEGERNFHSFYNLVYGASESELSTYGLKSSMISQYSYLNQSSASMSPTNDDKTNYRLVNDAMRISNFDSALVKTIWSLVAVVIHLGDLKFDDEKDQNNNNTTSNGEKNGRNVASGAQVAHESMDTVRMIAKLLNIDESELVKALTSRLIASGSKEVVTTFHTAKEASYARDALAKVKLKRIILE